MAPSPCGIPASRLPRFALYSPGGRVAAARNSRGDVEGMARTP